MKGKLWDPRQGPFWNPDDKWRLKLPRSLQKDLQWLAEYLPDTQKHCKKSALEITSVTPYSNLGGQEESVAILH